MTIDLTQFHDAFFEESFEALDSMEAALLKLDIGKPEPELINTIFRVAHSIKGGSATFGFSDIASFTHSCETLLDELRSGSMQVTTAISDLLLKTVDIMRDMLRSTQSKQPIDMQKASDVQFDVESMIAQKNAAGAANAPAKAAPAAAPAAAAPANTALAHYWRINFRPYPELFARGNDPLRMLRELAELGELQVEANLDGLPLFPELDPQSCYLAWEMKLSGNVAEDAIKQVFEWAEGDCELSLNLVDATGALAAAAAAASEAVPPATAAAALGAAPAAPATAATVTTAPAPAAAGSAPATASATTAPAAAASAPTATASAPAAPAPAAPAAAAPDKPQGVAAVGDSGSIRVSVEKIDELMNTVGELVITQAMLSQLGNAIEGPHAEKLRAGLAQLERNTRELQESVMRVRMLPISFVFSRFPRMVRDIAQRLGKQIDLKLTGEQTELDKTVLEKIGDPLVHLVRNSIDHGIEMPDKRMAAGKPAAGTVHLDACHRGGNIAVDRKSTRLNSSHVD